MTEELLQQDDGNATGEQAPDTQPEQNGEQPKFTQAQLDAIIKDRLERADKQKEAASKAAAEAAKAEELKAKQEWQTLAEQREKELKEIQSKYEKAQSDMLKRDIAAKIGLPEALALRLQGTTAEELEADAKTILETLPKPDKPKPGLKTTSPSGGGDGETEDQRKRRLGLIY